MRHTLPAARMRRVTRSTRPIRTASRSSARSARRPSARWAPIDRRRRPRVTGRGSRLCDSAWRWRPAARPRIATQRRLARAPRSRAPSRSRASGACAEVTCPTPHSRSTGSGCRNASSSSGGDHQQAVGLGHRARDLREELRPRDADGDRETDLPRTSARSRVAISGGVPEIRSSPRTSRKASSIDSASTTGRVLEEREHRLAGLAVGRIAAARPSPAGTAARLPAAHRGADPAAPWPRSWPRARRPPPRSRAGRTAWDRRAARPRRRTSRGRRGGSSPAGTNICSHRRQTQRESASEYRAIR